MHRHTRKVPAPGGTYLLADYEVARIGYGTVQLRKFEADPAKAEAQLRHALELGVDHIDTAQFYGNGFVNKVIRNVLPAGDSIVVASKVGVEPDPTGKLPARPAQRPEQLRASLEDNLVSLGMERIPLVNLRRTDVAPGVSVEGDQIVDIDDQMAEMIAMRKEGKIGSIGLSGVNLDGLTRALPAGIVCVQNAYSIVSREYENLLTACLDHGIAWVPFFPLGGVFPGWPKVTDHPKVIEIAKHLSITPPQIGLAWLLRHSPNTLLIPGTAEVGHLEENIAAGAVVLDEQVMTELNNLNIERLK